MEANRILNFPDFMPRSRGHPAREQKKAQTSALMNIPAQNRIALRNVMTPAKEVIFCWPLTCKDSLGGAPGSGSNPKAEHEPSAPRGFLIIYLFYHKGPTPLTNIYKGSGMREGCEGRERKGW